MTEITVDSQPGFARPALWVGTSDPGTLPTVLHVEDDPNDVLLLSLAFRKAQVPVQLQHVADGQQAVNYLGASAAYLDRHRFPFPGLVLLDLKMPNLDGFGVLAWARAQAGMAGLMIIVLSSSNQPQDISRAKALGADEYLVKTSGYSEVISVVQEYLHRSKRLPHSPPARGCLPRSEAVPI